MRNAGADAGGDFRVQLTRRGAGNVEPAHFGRVPRLQMLTPHLRQLHRSASQNAVAAESSAIWCGRPLVLLRPSAIASEQTGSEFAAVRGNQPTNKSRSIPFVLKCLIRRDAERSTPRCGCAINGAESPVESGGFRKARRNIPAP